jgi:hypothetical protein
VIPSVFAVVGDPVWLALVEHRAPLSDDENFHRHAWNKIDGWR